MADTTARVLALLTLLESRRYWPGTELARRLEVSVRTIRRDAQRLRDLGYPVEAVPGVGGGYQLAAGATLPPLVLDDDEAVALVVGLHTNAAQATAGVAEASVRALAKTLTLMPPRLRARADALREMTVHAPWRDPSSVLSPVVLDTVAGACHDGVRLGFSYTARSGAESERYVEPYRLVVLGHRWYLLAFDLDRDDWRTFRVDRVGDARATVARFSPREAPVDPVAFVRASMDQMPRAHRIVVEVDAPAADVEARIGRWAAVEPVSDTRCRARMTADDLEWPAFALMRLDADFVVQQPDQLRDLVAGVAARFGAAAATR
jgi:predicted DNA-binding transcriptional regulator YafY